MKIWNNWLPVHFDWSDSAGATTRVTSSKSWAFVSSGSGPSQRRRLNT